MTRDQMKEHEDRVLAQMVWYLTFPGPHIPEEISTEDLINSGKWKFPNNRIFGMTEKEIRNTIRRLKRKGQIERSWQRRNPDQPSGEYGEVWSADPFIPHHGYTLTEAGWESKAAQEAKEWVDTEWEKTVKMLLGPDPEEGTEVGTWTE